MNADFQDFKYKELTDKIIKIFYRVYNKLGYGFLEKVYENALMIGFEKENILAIPQSPVKVILEIKTSKQLVEEHEAQLLNYLKATDIKVGLLLNFSPKPEFKRKAFNNSRKNYLQVSA